MLLIKVIGLIKILDQKAYEAYRSQVGQTVAIYGGSVAFRGEKKFMPCNELDCQDFDACVELEFPSEEAAQAWSLSPEYSALLPVRSKAMRLLLFAA